MPIDAGLLKEALEIVYLCFYGLPFDRSKTLPVMHAKYYGILHAASVMELIPALDWLCQKHDKNYRDALNKVASQFSINAQELLLLIQITTLFLASRQEDTDEIQWDHVNAVSLYYFLIKRGISKNLASVLKCTIFYKDNQECFITSCEAIPGTSLLSGTDADYLRQLVKMADKFGMIIGGRVEAECQDKILLHAIQEISLQLRVSRCESLWSTSQGLFPLIDRYSINSTDKMVDYDLCEKLLDITTYYINKKEDGEVKKKVFTDLRAPLLQSNISRYGRIVAFQSVLMSIDKEKIFLHRTDQWPRYIFNILCLLIVVPALARMRSSYLQYKTVQFWKPESERAFLCAENLVQKYIKRP